MNYKELQNRKYLFQLLINLNSNLKGLLKEELLDVNNMDYIIHTLIDSKYWLYFGLEKEVEYSYLEGLSKEDGKEVTFNKINGVSYYYSPYNRYNVKLPINEKCYLELHIYPNDSKYDKEIASKTFTSVDVQEVLNTIKISEN